MDPQITSMLAHPPQNYCMFVGYQQSGHTIVGAILDAHPNAIIAHELHALTRWEKGESREELFTHIAEKSYKAAQNEWHSNGYTYGVPGQWQGKCEKLKTIGDKKGALSTNFLGSQPDQIRAFREYVGLPLRFIHVIRSPFDNVASISLRTGKSMHEAYNLYNTLAKNMEKLQEHLMPDELHELRTEDFKSTPKTEIRRILKFLGLPEPEGYIDACASIVNREKSRKRELVAWPDFVLARTQMLCREHPFLHGYTYEN